MSRLKIGKQMRILNMGQACQGTETFGVIFMLFIIHDTKIHAYARCNKSNLYKLYYLRPIPQSQIDAVTNFSTVAGEGFWQNTGY